MMEVKLTPAPLPRPPQVTITLSYKEACALMAICGKVGGPEHEIKKWLTDPLYYKLEDALGQGSCYFPEPFTEELRAAEGFWEQLPNRP